MTEDLFLKCAADLLRLIYWRGYLKACRELDSEIRLFDPGMNGRRNFEEEIEVILTRVTNAGLIETGRVLEQMPGPPVEETEP
jgi:hypothetical protein